MKLTIKLSAAERGSLPQDITILKQLIERINSLEGKKLNITKISQGLI